MAVAQTKLHQPENAMKEYRETLRLSPDSAEALTELSNLLATASDTSSTSGPEGNNLTQKNLKASQP